MKRQGILALFLFLCCTNLPASDTLSFAGVQTHFGQFYRADMDSVSMEAQLDLIAAAGFDAIRDECYWADVEKERGVYSFPKQIDDYVHAAARRGIKILLILNYNNPLYAPHAGSQMTTDSNRTAYAKYCTEVVKRYSPLGVKQYEWWNEPNLPMFWDPTPNASDYVKMIKAAYQSVKSIDSSVILIGGATSPLEGQSAPNIPWTNFITKVVQDSGLKYMDAISFHQYRVDKAPELWLSNDIQTIQLLTGNTKPVWLTEVGYHTSSLWPYTTQTMQADYVTRMYLLGLTDPALRRISYYDFKNDGTAGNNAEHNFGIVSFDRSPKPAYHALKTLLTTIRGKTFRSMSKVFDNRTVIFGDSGSAVIAYWNSTAAEQRTIPVGTRSFYSIERDGARKLFITSNGSFSAAYSSSPRYVVQLPSLPKLKSLRIEPKMITIDTSQSFLFKIKGEDSLSNGAEISSALGSWKMTGSVGTVDSLGTFRATMNGTGKLIVTYQGMSDTAAINVFIPAGSMMMNDFSDPAQWSLSVSNMDSGATSFSISNDRGSTGPTSGKLDYAFTHKTGLGISSYRSFLQTDLPVPGKPDSVMIDVYGNGQPHRIEFRFKDLYGEYFSKTAADQPTSWLDMWKPVKIWMKGFGANVDYPITLDRMTVYTVPNILIVDSLYSGSIYLDNLRVTFNPSTPVTETFLQPARFHLSQNFPNPFNPSTTIRYEIPLTGFVELSIFDLLGKKVRTVVNEIQQAGSYAVDFSPHGNSLSSGLYFYRLSAGGQTAIRKMIYMQ